MDRDALALRNRAMAEAMHATPPRHYLRRGLLRFVARLPISEGKGGNRILLIRPDHLGDTLLLTPAIHALRRALPDAELHALVGPWSAEVLANYDTLDTILTLPFPGFSRNHNRGLRFPYQLALRSANQLRQVGYSSVLILRPDHWWGAMVAYMAGIPQRIGYDHTDVAPFLTHPVASLHQHAVLQNLRLVEQLTGEINTKNLVYHFQTNPEDRAYIDGYLAEWGIPPEKRIICIHPGSGTWVKRWDESHWADVADTLIDQLDAAIVLTGSDKELLLAQAITQKMQHPACIIVGDTEVGQLANLFERALVVMGPDSGPMHLAAAVDTPTVTLFGPADPAEFAPWGSRQRHIVLTTEIACRPCRVLDWGGDNPEYHPCVREITVGRVLEAARTAVG